MEEVRLRQNDWCSKMPNDHQTQKRIAARITGRVQGVGFRYFTEETANRSGISGWVANRSDGSVELEAQGAAPDIEEFISRLRRGPPLAHVSNLHVTTLPLKVGKVGFEIR